MRIKEIEKINRTSWIYAWIISFLLLATASGFIYTFHKINLTDIAFEIRTQLIAAFNENENIADAITAKYSTVYEDNQCPAITLAKERHHYGFNYSATSADTAHNGTLITLSPLDKEGECLIEAVSFIIGSLKDSDLLTSPGFRYLLADSNKLIYTFKPLSSEQFHFSRSKMFNDMSTYVDSVPEYYSRKLIRNIFHKGTVATPLYEDQITNESAYSIVSFIYNLNQSSTPVAYLLYDHTRKELEEEISPYTGGLSWLKVSIHELATGKQLCITNCDKALFSYKTVFSEPLSGKYTLNFEIDVFRCILSSLAFKLALLTVILFSFLLKRIIYRKRVDTKEESIIDHLTTLYNRKVIPLVRESLPLNCYIVIIDCNRFKEINDLYGHNAGDDILIFIGDTIKAETRSGDIGVRHGGDEFMIILDLASLAEAQSVIKRVADRISAKEFLFDGVSVRTSISYGVARFEGDLQAAIHQADQGMYAMKSTLKRQPDEGRASQ